MKYDEMTPMEVDGIAFEVDGVAWEVDGLKKDEMTVCFAILFFASNSSLYTFMSFSIALVTPLLRFGLGSFSWRRCMAWLI